MEEFREKYEKYLTPKTTLAALSSVFGFYFLYSKYTNYLIKSKRDKILENQSFKVESKETNRGDIHRHYKAKDGPINKSIYKGIPNTKTLYESFMLSVKNYPNNNCLGSRKDEGPYEWLSYKKVEEISTNFGSGLIKLGLNPHDFVGIFSPNNQVRIKIN